MTKSPVASLLQVEEAEGRELAERAGTAFYEVSVAENSADIYQAFELLVGECRALLNNNNNNNNNSSSSSNSNGSSSSTSPTTTAANKMRKFSVTKMLGTLIGSKSSSPPPSSAQGTVVVCQKSDLYRSGVLKRRHKTSITASL